MLTAKATAHSVTTLFLVSLSCLFNSFREKGDLYIQHEDVEAFTVLPLEPLDMR